MAGGAGPTSLLDGTIWGFVSALPIALYHYYPHVALGLVTLLAAAASTLYLAVVWLTPVTKTSSRSELSYVSPASAAPQPLPSLLDDAEEVQLSVVVPAYNERERLPIMLRETVEFLESLRRQKRSLVQGSDEADANVAASAGEEHKDAQTVRKALYEPLETYEIVLVDDGSRDGTHEVALEFGREHGVEVRVVRLVKNRGKGGAVRHGVLHSRGSLVLFADADGATRFGDVSTLSRALAHILTPRGHAMVVGSRAHMVKSDAVVKRSWLRNLLMHSFHLLLTLLLRPPTPASLIPAFLRPKDGCASGEQRQRLPVQPEIKDTQCGFKLFTRPTAKLVFPASHIDGWIFDVELILLAQAASNLAMQSKPPCMPSRQGQGQGECKGLEGLALPIAEVAVHWHEVGGSKIALLTDSVRMALDLVVIRANYGLRRWQPPPPAL